VGNTHPRWRRELWRELTVLMALKVAALVLLWWLFFSPAHRVVVDAEATADRLGVARAAATSESAAEEGKRR